MPELDDETVGYHNVLLQEEVGPSGQPTWTASHPELLGCSAVGSTQLEALMRLAEVREAWLAAARRLGRRIAPVHDTQATTTVYAVRPESMPTRERDGDSALQETLEMHPSMVAA